MSSASLFVTSSDPILCFYINRTHQTQIVRFVNLLNQGHDRVVRTHEHLLFEALPGEMLEIYVITSNCTVLSKSFNCNDLKVSSEIIENMLRWLS